MARVEVAAPQRSRNHRNLVKRNVTAQIHEVPGLRERKKARLRQEIIETAIRLFRKQGYEKTRIDDIVKILEISQPTFFRYFPSKDAVLRDVGRRGFECIAAHLKSELSTNAGTGDAPPSLISRAGARSGSRSAAMESGGAIGRNGSGAFSRSTWGRVYRGWPASGD